MNNQSCTDNACTMSCSNPGNPCKAGCCDGAMCQNGGAKGTCGDTGGACVNCGTQANDMACVTNANGGTCGCITHGDCDIPKACGNGQCTSNCTGGLECNQGCCASGTCVAGNSAMYNTTCGTSGFGCTDCTAGCNNGPVCLSNGYCGCTMNSDCMGDTHCAAPQMCGGANCN